jgi:phosphoglycerate kinase
MSHQGGDLEYQNFVSTFYHAKVLSELTGKKVDFIDDVCGPYARQAIKSLKSGQILLLDNVRYMAQEMTLFETKLKLNHQEQQKTIIIQKLSPLTDIYVCDAFAAAHRDQPTLVRKRI